MKRPSSFHRLTTLPKLAASLFLASAPLLSAQTAYWQGPSGTGDSGAWDLSGNWSLNAIPTNGNTVRFDYNDTYPSKTAEITLAEGVEANAAAIGVRHGKQVTFLFEDGASLTATGNLSVSADSNSGSNIAKFQGPETGEATLKIHRILATSNTGERNTVEFSGSGLQVEQTGSYGDFNNGGSLILSDGASLTAFRKDSATQAGDFHLRATSANGLNNRLLLENGHLSANLIYAYADALVQLSKESTLSASGTTSSLYINHGSATNGARFEVEGSGLDASVTTRVYEHGTLAIGLSDPDTGARTQAARLTLDSTIQLNNGSILEIKIFGAGDDGIDQIHLTGSDTSKLTVSVGALFDLKLNGYTPTLGESWTVFTGDTSKILRGFDLSLVDTTMWDLSNFNETGGWVIVSQIPEPSGMALLLVGGTGMIALLRRLRQRNA